MSNKLTVLMPVKNYYRDFLQKSVASILTQTSPHWKLLIIVEENDEEKFRKILNTELKDDRIKLIINEGRKLAGAFNTGMRYAESEFVAILLSDDAWTSEAVETLNRYITEFPEVDFFHSSRIIIDENDKPLTRVYKAREKFTLEDFKLSSPVKHLLCWRREKALEFGGMDETLNSVGPDDFDFPWTMAEHGAVFKAVDECLYLYRDHHKAFRLTTHLPLTLHKKEIERILIKHGVEKELIRQRIAYGEKTYLRQCIYENNFQRILRKIFDFRKVELDKS